MCRSRNNNGTNCGERRSTERNFSVWATSPAGYTPEKSSLFFALTIQLMFFSHTNTSESFSFVRIKKIFTGGRTTIEQNEWEEKIVCFCSCEQKKLCENEVNLVDFCCCVFFLSHFSLFFIFFTHIQQLFIILFFRAVWMFCAYRLFSFICMTDWMTD